MVDPVTRELRDYQHPMIEHIIARPRANVWARMGAGKTAAVLHAVDWLSLIDPGVLPVLVIAPKRVAMMTWPDEVKAWPSLRHLRCRFIGGTAADRSAALRGGADVYTIAYDNVQWLMDTLGDRWFWPTVVFDESTRLKGFRLKQGSKRARALARIAHTRATRWINLTGTPSANGLQDLWGQQWFIDRGLRLGRTYGLFRNLHFYDGYDGRMHPQRGADDEIKGKLRDCTITIDPRKYLSVNEPNVVELELEMPADVKAKYKRFRSSKVAELEGTKITAASAAALSMKLRQFANGFMYDIDEVTGERDVVQVHDLKLDALESIVEEQGGAPLLVAYHFREDLARIRRRFPQARELDADEKTLAQWNAGEIPILCAHPKSAGHGLNLAAGGSDLCFYSHDWNAEEREQIIERLGPTRQAQLGRDVVVNIYNLRVKDTIDVLIKNRVNDKVDVTDALMAHMEVS